MSKETSRSNIGTVKQMYESFAEGDMEGVVATWASDIELNMPKGFASDGAGISHGPDEIIENVFADLANDWGEVSSIPEQFFEEGDTVVALGNWRGTYTETGKEVEFPEVHVFEFEDGTIARWTSHGDTALWNAALEE